MAFEVGRVIDEQAPAIVRKLPHPLATDGEACILLPHDAIVERRRHVIDAEVPPLLERHVELARLHRAEPERRSERENAGGVLRSGSVLIGSPVTRSS